MYLRAAKVEAEDAGIETDGMANSVSELRDSILSLTNNRVDIMENDTDFKSTIQIMREIASVYDSLTDVDAAALLELLSGKRQANTTAALIKNWDQVENVIQTSMNGAGSAAKENAHYLDSIEGKSQQFAAAFDKLSTSLLSSDLVKGFVDTGSGILGFFQKLIDFAGAAPAVLTPVLSSLMKLKGYSLLGTNVNQSGKTVFDPIWSQLSRNRSQFIAADDVRIQNDQARLREYIQSSTRLRGADLEAYFKNSSSAVVDFSRHLDVANMSVEDGAQAVERYGEQQRNLRSFSVQATSALKGFGASLLNMAAITAVIMAVQALVKVIDSAHMSAAEAAQVTADVDTAYSSSMSELSKNVDTITSLSDRFTELSAGVSSTGENISLTASQYEEYRDIVKQLVDLNPTLIQGYNAQGDAIINQNDAIQKSIQLMRQQQIAAARESLYGGRETNDGGKTNYEASFIDFEAKLKDQRKQIEQSANDSVDFLSKIISGAKASGNWKKAVDTIFSSIGTQLTDYTTVSSALDANKYKIADSLPQIMSAFSEMGIVDQEAISNSESLTKAYQMEKEGLDQVSDSLRNRMQAMYESNEGYYDLSNNAKSFLENFKQSISSEQIHQLGEDGLMSMTTDLLDSVMSDTSIQKSIDDMYDLLSNRDNIPISDFESRGEEIISAIQNGVGNSNIDVSEIFGFDSLTSDVDAMISKVKENLESAFEGMNSDLIQANIDNFDFDDLSITQIQTLNKLLTQSGDNAFEVANVLSQFAAIDLLPQSLDEFSTIFEDQVTAVEAAKDALGSYQSAVEDMMTEADTHESFVEIFDEFSEAAKRGQLNTEKAREQMKLLIGDVVDLDTARQWVNENKGLFLTGTDEELGAQELPAIYDTLRKKYDAMTESQREYVDSLMSIDWESGSFLVADADIESVAKAFEVSTASMSQALGVMSSYSDQEFIDTSTLKKQADTMVSISDYLSENVDKDAQATTNAWKSLWGKVDWKVDFEKIASSMGLDATDMSVEEVLKLGDAFSFLSESLNSLPKNTQLVSNYIESLEKANSIDDKSSDSYKQAIAQVEEYEAKIRELPPELLTRYGIEIPSEDEVAQQIDDLEDRFSNSNIEISSIVNAKVDDQYVPSDLQNQIVQGDGIEFALHYIPVLDGESISDDEIKAYVDEITQGAKSAQEVLQRDADKENGGKGILVRVSAGVTLDQDNENGWDELSEQMISDLQDYQNALNKNGLVLNLSQIKTQIAADGDGALSGVLATIDQINEKAGDTIVTLQQLADGSWQIDVSNLDALSQQLDVSQEKAAGLFQYIADVSTQAGTPVDFTIDGKSADEQLNGFMSEFDAAVEKLTQQYPIDINYNSVDEAKSSVGNLSSALQALNNLHPTVRVSMAVDPLPKIISSNTSSATKSSSASSNSNSIKKSGYSGITGKMTPLTSMASGGQSAGGDTLVGELGRELWISRDGKNKKIVGKHGMEVINTKPGDAIVPNNLTERLIRGGMSSAASGKGPLDNWNQNANSSNSSTSNNSTSSQSSSTSKKSSSSSSSSSSKKEDDTYADWLEEQLDIMQHLIDVWNEKGGFEKFGDEILAKYSEMQKLVHDAAEHYRKLGYAETSEEIRDLQDKWFEYRNAIQDVYKDIYDAQKSSAEGSISILESQFEMIEQKIGISSAAFRENSEIPISISVSDDAFNLLYEQMKDNAEQQIELQTQIMQAAHKEADRYRDMGYLDTSEEIQELKQTYLSAQQSITELKQTVADKLVSQFDDFIDLADTFNRWDNLKTNKLDVLRRKLTQINQLLSDGLITLDQYKEYMVDVSESIYNEQKDAIESIIDLTMDMLKQQQQDEIDAIQEQVDLYQQKVDLIKETIRLNGDEDDYQRELEKKLREIAQLQAKIDQLSLDDSREAAAQKAELAEQLAQLQDELAELQGDRGIEIQEEALDKENEKFQDASDEKIDILEDQYSSTQKLHDAAIKYIEENWSTLKDQLIQYNYQYGDSLEDEIINKWEIARQAVERYGLSVNAALQGIENENIGMASDKSAIIDIIQQMQSNSQKWLSDPENRDEYSKANQRLGSQLSQYGIDARYDDKSGKWFVGDTELYDLIKYPNIIDQLIGSKYPVSDSGDGDTYLDDDYSDLDESDAKFQARKEDILDVIERMYRNQQSWLQTNDTDERDRLSNENDDLAIELSRLGLSYYHDHRAGTWTLGGKNGPLLYSAVNNPDILDTYIRYHTGGIAGSLKPNEVAAVLERGEAIYTEEQNAQIQNILEMQQKLAQVLSRTPTSLSSALPSIQSSNDSPSTLINQNSSISFAPKINISISSSNKNDSQLVKDIRDSVLDSIRSAFSQSGIMSSRMQFRPV